MTKCKLETPKQKEKSSACNPVLPGVTAYTLEQCKTELNRIQEQFCVIHSLEKIDGASSLEYMREALHFLRQRCIELHWRQIYLIKAKYE